MATDFFDDDLVHDPAAGGRRGEESAQQPDPETESAQASVYDHKKQQISETVAGATDELERLKQRQEDLEREKQALLALRKKQDDYEQGRHDMINKLSRSVVLLQKEEEQAARMATLYTETRDRFRALLDDLRRINQDAWAQEEFEGELSKALALVDTARTVYRQALDRIHASAWHKETAARTVTQAMEEGTREPGAARGFGYWLMVGLAVTLPLVVVLICLYVAHLFAMGLLP